MQHNVGKKDSSNQHLAIVPRYPLLGGWQTEIVLGYALPLASSVVKIGTKRTLVFIVPPLLDMVRRHCKLDRVVLFKGQMRCCRSHLYGSAVPWAAADVAD